MFFRWTRFKKLRFQYRHPRFPLKWIEKIKLILAWDLRPYRLMPNIKFFIKHSILAISLFLFLTKTFFFINPALFYAYIFLSLILMIKF